MNNDHPLSPPVLLETAMPNVSVKGSASRSGWLSSTLKYVLRTEVHTFVLGGSKCDPFVLDAVNHLDWNFYAKVPHWLRQFPQAKLTIRVTADTAILLA